MAREPTPGPGLVERSPRGCCEGYNLSPCKTAHLLLQLYFSEKPPPKEELRLSAPNPKPSERARL